MNRSLPMITVVVDSQVEELGALDELAGEPEILAARGGIAARMIVEKDDGGRGLEDGRLEHLARVDEAGRERPFRHHDIPEKAVLRVEEGETEDLLPEGFHERA